MDQLHEELKQPVPSMGEDSESSDSDDDEPNHHNKRLLGGTSLPYSRNLQNGMDVDTLPCLISLYLSLFLFLNFSCWLYWGCV